MNQPLRPAFLCAIAAAIVLGIAKDMSLGTIMVLGIELNQSAMNNIGTVLVIMGFAWGTPAVFDRLIGSAWAFGEIAPGILHKEVAMVHAQAKLAEKIGGLDRDQLTTFRKEAGLLVLFQDNGMAGWEIKSKGRFLSSQLVSEFLYRCENNIPANELPTITRNAPGSATREDEEALVDFFDGLGYCQFRSGLNYEWINDWTPETVREVYFDK